MFGFLFKKKERIYCQECGDEIIGRGGYVSHDGKIYCIREVAPMSLIALKNPNFFAEYAMEKEIRQLIKDKKLIHFSKLEKSIER